MIKMYVLMDKQSQTTNQPMPFTTDRDAIDGLRQVATDEKTSIHKHPDDFVLYYLGTYDQREMAFELLDHPKKVISVRDILNEE